MEWSTALVFAEECSGAAALSGVTTTRGEDQKAVLELSGSSWNSCLHEERHGRMCLEKGQMKLKE